VFIYFSATLFTFENERSAVGFLMSRAESTPIFYNSEASHIVKI
jgi:hypothetical protein